jgi:tRNA A37 N6-isopentenylltransferase MiaA
MLLLAVVASIAPAQAQQTTAPQDRVPAEASSEDAASSVHQHESSALSLFTARFDAMLDAGLVDEVRALRARPGLTADSASMRAVGYRQLWSWLDRKLEFTEARQRAIIATRQLAKRQLTWLRSDRKSEKLPAGDADNLKCLRKRVRIVLDSA